MSSTARVPVTVTFCGLCLADGRTPASHRGFGLGYRVQNAVLAKLEKLCWASEWLVLVFCVGDSSLIHSSTCRVVVTSVLKCDNMHLFLPFQRSGVRFRTPLMCRHEPVFCWLHYLVSGVLWAFQVPFLFNKGQIDLASIFQNEFSSNKSWFDTTPSFKLGLK